MKNVLVVVGTRPEAIKLAPVILELRRRGVFHVAVAATGQHKEILEQSLAFFQITPDINLDVMSHDQSLSSLTARLCERLPEVLKKFRPQCVLVQGDTTTAFAGALAAFYDRVPVAHVEAGLRTSNIYAPFPEEINRRLVSTVARWHFVPTERARENLLRENVPSGNITLTGNTVIDALMLVAQDFHGLPPELEVPEGKRMILVTAHRRESFGHGMKRLCVALKRVAENHPDVLLVYPVHRNPNVRGPVEATLSDIPNIRLIDPVEYQTMVALMMESTLIITDSGGVQEEAPALGKPVLVTREVTERAEAIEAGCAKLVGTDVDAIVNSVATLLNDPAAYARMAHVENPFGDGHASERIAEVLEREL